MSGLDRRIRDLDDDLGEERAVPQVTTIFFDAVGTLFGVKGSVGQIYGQIARRYGMERDPQELDRAFYQAFKAAPAPLFAAADPSQLIRLEREWWRQIVVQTFEQMVEQIVDQPEESGPFPHFEAFFTEVFDLFATAQPWQIYDETFEILKALQDQGFKLGIISNFDTRLTAVLTALGLDPFFSTVTISTQTGWAKPQAQVFQIALHQAQISASEALHVGDSFSMDYRGAKQAGLWALWLDRDPQTHRQTPEPNDEQERISDLRGILGWLRDES